MMHCSLLRWLLVLCICFCTCLHAQVLPINEEKDFKQDFNLATGYYGIKQYSEALQVYKKLLNADPDNANLNFLAGDCLANLDNHETEAITYLSKAIRNTSLQYTNSSDQRNAPVTAFLRLGDMYYFTDHFSDALVNYRIFKTYVNPDKDKLMLDELKKKMAAVSMAERMLTTPLRFVYKEIPGINDKQYSCFGAQVTEDGNSLYFSRKSLTTGNDNTDIYFMQKLDQGWSKPQAIEGINSKADDNISWVSRDGNAILLSTNRDGHFHIYHTFRKGKLQWSDPEKLNSNINSADADETFASISEDGQYLYFVSNRKGGFGGKDIYRSFRSAGGDWGIAENLGVKINTTGDEDTPFVTDNGKTLFFSSNAHQGIGGFDVFYSNLLATAVWSDPVNLGFPVNTTGDDLYFLRSWYANTDYYIARSKHARNQYTIHAITEAGSINSRTENKAKDGTQERPRLKLVPKPIKY